MPIQSVKKILKQFTPTYIVGISQNIRTPPFVLPGRMENLLSEIQGFLFPIPIITTDDLKNQSVIPDAHRRYTQLERLMDQPGELSPSGRRHGNDFHQISQIRILPTKNELHSNRPEYLPVNDHAATHFLDGPARLFDIHFRLLREDMIGPLRSSIAMILGHLKPSGKISKELSKYDGRRDATMASIRLYYDVTVESVRFDRFLGLKFRLRFQQPKRFQSLYNSDRVQHWDASKSLDKGALICLVSNIPDVECFLTVAGKNKDNLGSDKLWSWINVVVAEANETAQEYLLRLSASRSHIADSLALLEFPGILLTGYKSILENLRTRSQHPYLPFSNVLCPRHSELRKYDSRNETQMILPPFYALSEGFQFNLAPLKREGASNSPLLLPPDATSDETMFLQKLEEETILDIGQCH